MNIRNAIAIVLLLTFHSEIAFAEDYWLQIKEMRVRAEDEQVIRSLEGPVSLGKPFYLRAVNNGFQIVITGSIEKGPEGRLTVEYYYDSAELRNDPPPRTTLKGTVSLRVREPKVLDSLKPDERDPKANADTKYVLSLAPFVPGIAFRDTSSVFVRLLDEAGKPVANAQVAFYQSPFLQGQIEFGGLVVGPVASDTNGIVRITEVRQGLPIYTLLAEHRERKLFAIAHLDRNLGDFRGYDKDFIYTVKMSKRFERPKLFQDRSIDYVFRKAAEREAAQ
jgi:hypothetical protein